MEIVNVKISVNMTNKYSLTAWHNDDRFANEWDNEVGIIYDTPINGMFRVYWPNGNKRYEWYYKDGKRANGVSRGWWPNGNLKSEHTLKDGKHDGLYTKWFENGGKEYEHIYKDGERV